MNKCPHEGLTNTGAQVAVCGFEITSNMCQAFKMMGYCPQYDALWNNLTVKEHLHLFASLRGVRYNEIGPVITWCVHRLFIRCQLAYMMVC